MHTEKTFFAVIVLSIAIAFCSLQCKSPEERKREAERLDSLRRDSAHQVLNPYKVGEGTKIYDRERENLGNLDSLVTPPQQSIPNR